MYDHIVGQVTDKVGSRIVLRTAGVGYEFKVSLTTSMALHIGQEQQLFTILHVVDSMPTLLGFATRGERELARRILNVTGIGPSIALSVLSLYSPAEALAVLARGDVAGLKRVKGVGQKTAERLCLELRDLALKLDVSEGGAPRTSVLMPQASSDAIAALVTLGFSEKEAKEKVEKVRGKQPAAETEELVKAVLQL